MGKPSFWFQAEGPQAQWAPRSGGSQKTPHTTSSRPPYTYSNPSPVSQQILGPHYLHPSQRPGSAFSGRPRVLFSADCTPPTRLCPTPPDKAHLPESIELGFQPPPLNHQPHSVGEPLWGVGHPSRQKEYLRWWGQGANKAAVPMETSVPAVSWVPQLSRRVQPSLPLAPVPPYQAVLGMGRPQGGSVREWGQS